MATRYRVLASSQRVNQTQQSMDITGDSNLTDANYANQVAASFAQRLNKDFFMHTNDWVPSIEPYEHTENPQPINANGDFINPQAIIRQ